MFAFFVGPSAILYLASMAVASLTLCAAALLTAWLLRRRSAPLRHDLLLSAVCLVAASPLLVAVATWCGLVGWQVAGAAMLAANRPAAAERQPQLDPQPVVVAEPAESKLQVVAAPESGQLARGDGTTPPAAGPRRTVAMIERVLSSPAVIGGVVAIWMLGIIVRLIGLGRAILILRKLGRSLVAVPDPPTAAVFERVRLEMWGLWSTVTLSQSPLAPAPLAYGLFRPTVVLPTELAGQLSADQLRLVLAHEAAHIARRDLVVVAIQWVSRTLFWWNPLLVAVNRRIERLREYICDDYAVAFSGNARGLAEVLIAIAGWAPACRLHISGATAIVDRAYDDLESRVARLVEARPICMRLSWAARGGLAAFVGLLVALVHLTTWGSSPSLAPAPLPGPLPLPFGEPLAVIVPPVGQHQEKSLSADDREALIERLRPLHIHCVENANTGRLQIIVQGMETTDEDIALLAPLENIGELDLIGRGFSENCLDTIGQFHSLRRLTIAMLPVSTSGIKKLANLHKLRRLELNRGARITDEALAELKDLPALEELSIHWADEITERGFDELASLPTLKSLSLQGTSITDRGLKRLAKSETITTLSLASEGFSNDGLRGVAALRSLVHLTLSNNNLTAAGIRYLKSAPQLDQLQLDGCRRLDDDSLSVVGELMNLRSLTLQRSSMTDAGLDGLDQMAALESLVLNGDGFTGAGLKQLAGLRKLNRLSVLGPNVTNEVFAAVHQFPLLHELSLGFQMASEKSKITDEGLKLIREAPKLTTIRLVGTAITDQGLASLSRLPQLTTVSSNSSPGITGGNWNRNARTGNPAAGDWPFGGPANAQRKEILDALRQSGLKAGMTSPNSLNLTAGDLTADGARSIARLSELEALQLRNVTLSQAATEVLARLPRLSSLVLLETCDLTDDDLAALTACTTLKHVALHGSNPQITAHGFESLAAIGSLETLAIGSGPISDDQINRLSQSRSISNLSLENFDCSDQGLAALAAMPNLQTLRLRNVNVTAEGLQHLRSAGKLEGLHLNGCPGVDAAALAAMGQLSSLRQLSVESDSMTDAGLAPLNSLGGLRSLQLSGAALEGTGLESLTALVELRHLTLLGERVSNEAFARLAQFPELRSLRVGAGTGTDERKITDAGLERIGNVPQLAQIDFDGTLLTDGGLDALRALPQLKSVNIARSPGVSRKTWRPGWPAPERRGPAGP